MDGERGRSCLPSGSAMQTGPSSNADAPYAPAHPAAGLGRPPTKLCELEVAPGGETWRTTHQLSTPRPAPPRGGAGRGGPPAGVRGAQSVRARRCVHGVQRPPPLGVPPTAAPRLCCRSSARRASATQCHRKRNVWLWVAGKLRMPAKSADLLSTKTRRLWWLLRRRPSRRSLRGNLPCGTRRACSDPTARSCPVLRTHPPRRSTPATRLRGCTRCSVPLIACRPAVFEPSTL
jgi:hypothetical protein